jgi:hypothetical protein
MPPLRQQLMYQPICARQPSSRGSTSVASGVHLDWSKGGDHRLPQTTVRKVPRFSVPLRDRIPRRGKDLAGAARLDSAIPGDCCNAG